MISHITFSKQHPNIIYCRWNTFGPLVVCVISRAVKGPIFSLPTSMAGSGRQLYKSWLPPMNATKATGRLAEDSTYLSPITVNSNRTEPPRTVWPFSTNSTTTVSTGMMWPAIIRSPLFVRKTMPFSNMSVTPTLSYVFKCIPLHNWLPFHFPSYLSKTSSKLDSSSIDYIVSSLPLN